MGSKIRMMLLLGLVLLVLPGCSGFSAGTPEQNRAENTAAQTKPAAVGGGAPSGSGTTAVQEQALQACELTVTGKDGSRRTMSLERRDKEQGTVTLRLQAGKDKAEQVLTGTCGETPFKSIVSLVKDLGLSSWQTLPLRSDYAGDHYRASLRLQFTNGELKFATNQQLPPVQDYVFYQVYTCLQYYVAGYTANLPYPLGANRPRDTVEVHGREVPILAGSGEPYLTNAILDYGDRKWWVEEGLVGSYTLVPGGCESVGKVKTAALQIGADGAITLAVNGQTLQGFVDKGRRYQADYTCSFYGRFAYGDDSYKTLKFRLPALPYPDKRPEYTFILQRM